MYVSVLFLSFIWNELFVSNKTDEDNLTGNMPLLIKEHITRHNCCELNAGTDSWKITGQGA